MSRRIQPVYVTNGIVNFMVLVALFFIGMGCFDIYLTWTTDWEIAKFFYGFCMIAVGYIIIHVVRR